MAARALTAAGRRVAGQSPRTTPLLASCRNGASTNHSSASARREEEEYKDVGAAAAAMTGAQVEAALNRKNVEVLQGEEHVATVVLPDETIGGALDGGEDALWVPDQDTGVFGPAHVDTHGGPAHPAPPHLFGGATATAASTDGSAASVLDQAVFVREEDMEDVERPAAVDMASANADVNDSIKNY